ncbi:hypothetical protein VVP001_102 [Vibrio phage VVP001]|uniref:Uncharacterized protein n=1 Tax=Vibrio phage VVP001 TaxID=2059877 RepID=A0A3Q8D296_9CAUD|nr:hypothetical protein VVP001_102 [Vibrio phage VVP001]
MTRPKRRLIVVEDRCFRGHAPIRIVRGSAKASVCYQCHRMQRKHARMVARCHNPKDPRYKNYGGRGISVCPEWRNSFTKWYEDFGYLVDGNDLTMDRRDNDGDYEPGNMRAATTQEQNRNQRRSVLLTYDGETLNQQVWADRFGFHKSSIQRRLGGKYRNDMEWVLFGVRTTITKTEVLITKDRKRLNLRAWCRSLGFSLRTVEDRVYKFGWSYAQALGFAPRKGKLRPPRTKD